ncbi:MAG: hypothetical protein ACRDWT_14100 [Jatrophihabitantaceae bacterium]
MGTQPGERRGPTAPDEVEQRSHELFDEARRIVAERFAEASFDPDRGLRVTVIDLNDQDMAAITGLAQRLGIAGWVRVERADPAALEAWEQLRIDLLRLRDTRPRVLQQYPTPEPGYRRPPVRIHLAPDAEATAAELHARYRDFVSLRVGALPYPPGSTPQTRPRAVAERERTPVDPAELRVALDGPLSIRSGQSTTHHLLLTNLSGSDITVHTNGTLTAGIIDANTGATVGGYAGAQIQPLVIFSAAPSETVRIPLLVGTASYSQELGYAVPPGDWHLTAPLDLGDGRRLVTGSLELTILD